MSSSINVLLIEDDRIDRIAFERLIKLENLPYNYTIASSVSEARKSLSSLEYDVIISDYNLGDGTADEIFDLIGNTPVIFATGGGDEEIAVNAMKSGAYDYLIKDPDRNYLKVLPVTIEKALRNKEAEEQLRLFESVIVNGNDAIIITDAEYGRKQGAHVVYVNNAFTQITGYKSEEIMGKNPRALFGKKTSSRELARIKRAITNSVSVRSELICYRKDGSEFWVDINIVPVADGRGYYSHWVSVLRDITSRKMAEEELIKAKQLAEESMKAKERFLANMSHEIRTPMNAVVGLTNLMMKMNLESEQREYVEAIKQSADNLLVIINDILDISKIEAGKITLEKIPFSVRDLLNNLVRSFKIRAAEKSLELKLAIDDKLPDVITGDPVRLNQILVNLVGNAIKFTEAGHVSVEVTPLEDSGDQITVLFKVTDTGIGIPEESQDKIFESFSQASSETTRKFGGTGLGLTISKQLVELQQGQIALESKVNEGAVFSFSIPFKKGGMLNIDRGAYQQGAEHGACLENLNVLLVEDNPMNRLVATKTLATWKVNVETAENGRIALEKVVKKKYDLILMDVQMPEVDGYEATRRIRQEMLQPIRSIPILAMTAGALKGDDEKCFAAGMNDYISKPFDPDVLFGKMAKLTAAKVSDVHVYCDEEICKPWLKEKECTDLTYLKKLADGSTEFVEEMILVFLQQTPGYIDGLKLHCDGKDWVALSGVAHKMRPTMSYMGIKATDSVIKEIEEFAKERKSLDQLPHKVEIVVKVCKKALKELEIKLSELKLPET